MYVGLLIAHCTACVEADILSKESHTRKYLQACDHTHDVILRLNLS